MKQIQVSVMIIAFSLFVLMQISCKKEDPIEKPLLSTLSVSEILGTTAKSGGQISDDGGDEVDSKGIVWSTKSLPTVESFDGITMEGSGSGVFLSYLTNLTPATTYYVRAYASNSAGISYGDQKTFTTMAGIAIPPTVNTSMINNISDSTAVGGGIVTSAGTDSVMARGVCWSTSPNPNISDDKTTDGTGTGSFTSHITGLNPATTYFVRAYATNSAGTAYGNEVVFTTTGFLIGVPCPGLPTITDYNGHVYNTVQIGNQCWMKENLMVRNYRNGTPIPNISNNLLWPGLSTGGRGWYENDSATYAGTYGALYNWYAVDSINELCPSGWHVPTDAEWTMLTDFFGGLSVAGGALKEIGVLHWNAPNTGATNSSGFTAIPGGNRSSSIGIFGNIGVIGYWWSSSSISANFAWSRSLLFDASNVSRNNHNKKTGYSVRCIKD